MIGSTNKQDQLNKITRIATPKFVFHTQKYKIQEKAKKEQE